MRGSLHIFTVRRRTEENLAEKCLCLIPAERLPDVISRPAAVFEQLFGIRLRGRELLCGLLRRIRCRSLCSIQICAEHTAKHILIA